MVLYSPEYVEHLKRGPFPGRVDPWAEVGRYHSQIHAGMLDVIAGQLESVLLSQGYLITREASLQISGGRQPDIFVRHPSPENRMQGDVYAQAAEAVQLDPGEEISDAPELEALRIYEFDTRSLVTVLELISPTNKTSSAFLYQQYRAYLLSQGVNFVEIDPTRSVQRLLESQLTHYYLYHIAIYLPNQLPRILGSSFGSGLRSCALPLTTEVAPIDPQAAYDLAYRRYNIAAQIEYEEQYTSGNLPFPSTFTPEQRVEVLQQLDDWLKRLSDLRTQE
jgi:hypothetical protein